MKTVIRQGIRSMVVAAVVAAFFVVQAGDQEAVATEVESADDEIASMEEGPMVRRQLLHRSGRIEVAPMGSFSLNDAFIRNAMPGIGTTYFLNNVFGLMGSFNFGALQFDTSLRQNMDRELDDQERANTSYSRIGWALDAGLVYVPAFGKFTLLNSLTTHYDFHLFGGMGVINEVADPAIEDGDIDAQMSGVRPGGMFGAGLRFFMADSVSLNFQVRNYLMARSQEVSQGDADLQFGNTVMFSAGIGLFWPGDIQISR